MNTYHTTKTKTIVIGRTAFWGHCWFDIFSFQLGLDPLYNSGIWIGLGFFGLTVRWRRCDSKEKALEWCEYWNKKGFKR